MHFIDPSGALGVALLTAAYACAAVSVIFYPLEKKMMVYGSGFYYPPSQIQHKEMYFLFILIYIHTIVINTTANAPVWNGQELLMF